jgi:CRP-like cAMP-binding protein
MVAINNQRTSITGAGNRFSATSKVLPLCGPLPPADLGVVRNAAFFHGLNDADLMWLLGTCRVRCVPNGNVVFCQADPASSFFLVLAGWVKVIKVARNGGMTVRRIVSQGGTLAEAACLAHEAYPGTAEAISPARLLEIPVVSLIDALGGRESLAFTMVYGMACEAEKAALKLEYAHRWSTQQRLAGYLLTLASHGSTSIHTSLPYDKSLLALSLGMTPETLSRAFSALRPLGVWTHSREIVIDDTRVLRGFCGLGDEPPTEPVES